MIMNDDKLYHGVDFLQIIFILLFKSEYIATSNCKWPKCPKINAMFDLRSTKNTNIVRDHIRNIHTK